MKILYFNWVQFDDPDRRGGGVTVYQNNLVREMIRLGHEVYFFSSGLAYSMTGGKTFIRRTRSKLPECQTFEVVNSPVMAPAHAFWGGEEVALTDRSMIEPMRDFVLEHGPFDVVHFQNLEGLPLSVLSKEVFGDAKLFFSAHNYFAVCPQVNLWRFETANCLDYNRGQSCTYCLPYIISLKRNLLGYQVEELLANIGLQRGTKSFAKAQKALLKLRGGFHLANRIRYNAYLRRSANPIWRFVYGKKKTERLPWLANRRALTRDSFEKNSVETIAVSERTRDVVTKFGLNHNSTLTAYIGTNHAEKFDSNVKLKEPRVPGQFTIAYLGYMRGDKGFYFLLDCLERMTRSSAATINVVVAARNACNGSLERLMRLNTKFRSVAYYDGFSAKELDHILEKADLGLIPSLWEDNLPQVAIEIVSRGIPILTSNLGGAQEISQNTDFLFKSGDVRDFIRALTAIVSTQVPLATFWRPGLKLFSMSDHSAELVDIYQSSKTQRNASTAVVESSSCLDTPDGEAAHTRAPA